MSIYDLTKGQSKIWVEKYLNLFMQENDFKLKKTRNSELNYFKKTDYGFQELNLGFLNSWPGTQIVYGYYIRYDRIEEICHDLLAKLNPEHKIKKDSHSIGTSQGSFDGKNTNSFMPEMVTVEEVKESSDLVINFLENTGFPLAERFKDIKELDKEINGENFWKSDWQMPFTLGGDFIIKRLIIAKLANEGNFEKMFQFHVDELNKIRLDKGIQPLNLNDMQSRIPFTGKYLRDLKV